MCLLPLGSVTHRSLCSNTGAGGSALFGVHQWSSIASRQACRDQRRCLPLQMSLGPAESHCHRTSCRWSDPEGLSQRLQACTLQNEHNQHACILTSTTCIFTFCCVERIHMRAVVGMHKGACLPGGGFMDSDEALLADRAIPIMLVPTPPLETPVPAPPPDPPPDPPRVPDPPPLLMRGRLRDPRDT